MIGKPELTRKILDVAWELLAEGQGALHGAPSRADGNFPAYPVCHVGSKAELLARPTVRETRISSLLSRPASASYRPGILGREGIAAATMEHALAR